MDKSYSVISRWKYDLYKNEFTFIEETKKRYNYSSNISYNKFNKRYYCLNYILSKKLSEILMYDDMLDNVLLVRQIEGEVKKSINYNIVTNDGKWFILLMDNIIWVYKALSLELVREYRMTFCNYFSVSNDGKYMMITDFIGSKDNICVIRIVSLEDVEKLD